MRSLRALLVAGLSLFVVSSTHYVGAAGPWEVEGGVYGGSGSGHLACGPDVRTVYGGLGGEVRYAAARGPREQGFAVDVGGALDGQRMTPIHCTGEHDCTGGQASGLAPAGRVRAGYDWQWFGFRAGGLVFSEQQPGGLTGEWLPDVALRFGPLTGTRVVTGLGAYDLATYERPGLYMGMITSSHGWDFAFHAGLHSDVSGADTFRESVTVRMPVARSLWLTSGVAISGNQYGAGGDSTLGIVGDW